MTKADEVLRRFENLNVWRRGDTRAPHKPLLVLLALGRLEAGHGRLLSFEEIEQPLTRLLEDFGPPRKSQHPELPFYHLQSDKVWQLEEKIGLRRRRGSSNFLKSELREFSICGGFPEPLFNELKAHPEVVRELAKQLLCAHFPESLHDAIAAAVGLSLDASNRRSQRDPRFRTEVIAAWGHSCVFCGFSVQLDNSDLGLEAAHIRWVQHGGPDKLDNGLACCSLHHAAFDRGAIAVSEDRRILVSSRVYGSGGLSEYFHALHGRPLRPPSRKDAQPKREFLAWHVNEVFRDPARD